MNALILAAGYATRLYPLTLTKAKPLLEVAGKPMIDWVLDNLAPIPELERVYVVTNAKFAKDLQDCADKFRRKAPKFSIEIINYGSIDDSDKLGAIGEICLAITRHDLTQKDLIVVSGYNLFSEPLADFARAGKTSQATLSTYDVCDLEAIKKYSSITTDSNGVVTRFEEKPPNPANTIAGIALYYFSRELVPLFATYIAAGNNPDQPGRFIQWLYQRKPVKAFQIKGTWFDIGSRETLEEANQVFAKFVR